MFLLRGLLVGATQCQLLASKIMPQSKRASKRAKSSEPELPEMIHCRMLEGCSRDLVRFTPRHGEFLHYMNQMTQDDCLVLAFVKLRPCELPRLGEVILMLGQVGDANAQRTFGKLGCMCKCMFKID